MAHHTVKAAYRSLVERINRFPQGAPPSDRLFQILEMLFSEREAGLVAQLPIKPFTVGTASRVWKMEPDRAKGVLDDLAGRAILLDLEHDGKPLYLLPPPMAGFFEFSMMRVREDVDQKTLAELFYQYLNVEEEFITALFASGETQLGRAFVRESVLSEEHALHVLDYERASAVIRDAPHVGVGICYCRHKMDHLGKACDAPMDICMTFGATAASLIKHGHARRIDAAEGIDLLQEAQGRNLVQFGENVRHGVSFICNCCGCCCEAMTAARRFGILHPVHTTNFLPVRDAESCNGCGKCVSACPVEAMSLVSANDPKRSKKKRSKLDDERCLGCGVCAAVCPQVAIRMERRPERVITPLNSVHRAMVMAIERGKLQNLIFDNRAHLSHRAMAAVLGVILRLPPVKQAMASRQVKSRYLEAMLARPRA